MAAIKMSKSICVRKQKYEGKYLKVSEHKLDNYLVFKPQYGCYALSNPDTKCD